MSPPCEVYLPVASLFLANLDAGTVRADVEQVRWSEEAGIKKVGYLGFDVERMLSCKSDKARVSSYPFVGCGATEGSGHSARRRSSLGLSETHTSCSSIVVT